MKLRKISDRIHEKLVAYLSPIEINVLDQSAEHVGHAGHVPGQETHFKIRIVSASFEGKSRLERHRTVYDILKEEIDREGVHALALDTKAPSEVAK